MTVFHTSAGGAARSIEAVTRLIGGGETVAGVQPVERVGSSPRGQRLGFLPHAQRVFDRRVEGVQAHAEQLGGVWNRVASRSPWRLSMSGRIRSGSSAAIAAATRAATGVTFTPKPSTGRRTSISSAIRRSSLRR